MATNPNAALFQRSTVSKTTTYTATIIDDIILCDTSGGAWTLTLPLAASLAGKELTIFKTTSDVNVITVDGNASETINAIASKLLYSINDYIRIFSTGSAWLIIDNGIKNRVQRLDLGSAVSATSSDVTDLKYTSLVDDRIYRLGGKLDLNYYGTGTAGVTFTNGSQSINYGFRTSLGSTLLVQERSPNWVFVSDGTTLVTSYTDTGSSQINPNTFITLEDITEQYAETTELD